MAFGRMSTRPSRMHGTKTGRRELAALFSSSDREGDASPKKATASPPTAATLASRDFDGICQIYEHCSPSPSTRSGDSYERSRRSACLGRQPGQVGELPGELHELNRRAQTQADVKVQSWLGVARRVIDLPERPFRREPVADRAPERNVEFSSTRAHPRLHVGVSRSGAIGIDVDAAHDIVALWL